MNAGQKSARRIAASHGPLSRDTVCTSCLSRMSRRAASTAAATSEQAAPTQSVPKQNPPVTSSAPAKAYRVLTSPLLSRPPLLTRNLTSFEKAYFLYQKRLNERLALPFSRYFYYKKGTPGDEEWKRKIRVRKTAARDIGVYNAYGDEGWNDEVLVGDDVSEPSTTVERLIRDAEGRPIVDVESQKEEEEQKSVEGAKRELQRVEVERPMSRETEADRKNDQRSLNRKLDRALYLMVKNKEGIWRFPEDRVYGRENLHQAAERILIQSAGINMNTFLIGNHPIGHHAQKYTRPITSTLSANRLVPTSTIARAGEEGSVREEYGEKVFFMKARIMAGQADLSKNEYGDQEFKWLAKEEVQDVVTQAYWSSVKNMLTER
ncbi:50S ribosomal subunit L30 [Hortaea werneckii]|uniref:Large ribosomal subunit protein mL46 n=2 Tax=Hortaea werneckii TaxID=91943 RepID=A0A3M7HKQ4_HORWE|nr:50S ribosomal subunit L30 [Hortaea werneckii]KAI6873930.1 50S ribosomal subunit L30 [Hortaea werneckii]KAI7354928.1 50S ribosomal subunit L30 [Hortaea werneckii]RMZ13843.1 hypothetical protein D0862_02196 [Hortaea werneckii]